MTDFDYWKKQYQATWAASSSRESGIAASLEQATGLKVVPVGLGATSSEFLSGPAAARGLEKGDADLAVVGTNVRLEVTGPLVASVDRNQPLWVRPDKVQNARRNATHEVWIVHHLPKDDLLRVISLDARFWNALDAGEFPIVTPRIRGAQERYHSISAVHGCIMPFTALIERLKQLRPASGQQRADNV